MSGAVLHHRRSTAFAVIGVIVAGAVLVFWRQPWVARPPIAVSDPGADLDERSSKLARPDYVGPDACAACHAERAAEFRTSRHFWACSLPDGETMPAAFSSKDAAYVTREPSLRFEMTRSGDDFFETAIRESASGEQRTSSRIDFVYGAGAATDEVYLTWHGDRLYELPIAWLHPQKDWGASEFDRYGAGDFSRELTPRCLECHNTWFEHSPGTLNQYKRDDFILGVTCETCHGPARDHVAFHEANPRAAAGESIVQPGRLSRELQMDLCASCHSNALKHRGPAFSYRPGKPLDACYRTVASKYPEDDHVANQTKYLRESKCFQKSETLTCTTCHDPHRSKIRTPGVSQSACLNCHQAADCDERHRLPNGVRNDCVGCHMPQRNKIQVRFQLQDDNDVAPVKRWEHRIAVDPVATQEVLLAWRRTRSDDVSRQEASRLVRSLNEHWLSEAESCRREYRFLAALEAYRQAFRLDPSPATRAKLEEIVEIRTKIRDLLAEGIHLMGENRPAEAIRLFREILDLKPDHAQVRGRLGTAYAATGQMELAVEQLQAAAKSDPDDPYGPAMLGWIAYLAGRPSQALEYYRLADEIEPYDAKINHQAGLALAKLHRWPEASERFRRVVKIDPNHASGFEALSHTLLQQDQREEALRCAQRAAALTDFKNANILITLSEAYAATGSFGEAGETAAKALAAAEAANAKLTPPVRSRLEAFRDRGRKAPKQAD